MRIVAVLPVARRDPAATARGRERQIEREQQARVMRCLAKRAGDADAAAWCEAVDRAEQMFGRDAGEASELPRRRASA